MEFDEYSAPPTTRERLQARCLMAENPAIFGAVPDECADCGELNKAFEDGALEVVRFDVKLADVAVWLCYFKEHCNGALRDDDDRWIGCGSRTTPGG